MLLAVGLPEKTALLEKLGDWGTKHSYEVIAEFTTTETDPLIIGVIKKVRGKIEKRLKLTPAKK